MDDGESEEKVAKGKSRGNDKSKTHEKGPSVPPRKTNPKIPVSSLIRREKVGAFSKKKKSQASKPTSYVPSVDTSRSKSSSDVVNMAIRKLRWREVGHSKYFTF